MSSLRRLVALSFVTAFGLALPGAAFAGHRHSRDCGHRYDDRYRGHDSRYDSRDYRGHGHSYGPRYSYHPSYRYSAPYPRRYGYTYGRAPYYEGGYYGGDNYYYDDYSYTPPPPRCRRPRVGFYFGF